VVPLAVKQYSRLERFRRGLVMLSIAALIIALGISASPGYADVEEGVEKYKAGEYEAAIQEWLVEAARDNPYALFFLGQVYRLGRGVDVDLGIAEYYYNRAARLNHVSAQGNLGTLYYFAEPPLRRVQDAISWWKVAARNGDARSQYMLSVLYFNGDNVEKNWPLAYAWVTLAEEGGVEEATAARLEMDSHLNTVQKAEAKTIAAQLQSDTPAPAKPETVKEPTTQIAQNVEKTPPPKPKPQPSTPPPVKQAEQKPEPQPVAKRQPRPSLAKIAPKEGGSTRSGATVSIVLPKPEPAEPEVTQPAPAPVKAQALDNWRVQFGAYRSAYNAGVEWERLQNAHINLLSSYELFAEEVDLGEKGTLFRAQFGPFNDRRSANEACGTLKALGGSCFTVTSPGK